MITFENIHIHGFRRLYDVDLKLKPLNVIIGANGCGKTSVLELFSLLAASASGKLRENMSDLGGIDANLTNLLTANRDKARFVTFDLMMGVPGYKPIEYHLSMTPVGVAYEISDEMLTQKRDKPQPFKHIECIMVTYDTSSRTTRGKGLFDRIGITTRRSLRFHRFPRCFKSQKTSANVWPPRLIITFLT